MKLNKCLSVSKRSPNSLNGFWKFRNFPITETGNGKTVMMMQKIFVLLVVLIGFGFSYDPCPEFIICDTSETLCPTGKFYRERAKVHKCCPGCVDLKGEDETCQESSDCEPGLTCGEEKKCIGDPNQACEFYKRYDRFFNKTKYWVPLCLPNGTYAPKQCKGEKMAGKCFCVNKQGERIFGEEEWSKAENMTCACSRLMDDLKKTKMEATFHCDHLGNFEPFQCDRKVCWCANPTTGVPYTVMVALEMMISLPCYNREAVGGQYFRQCDSSNHMQEVTRSLLSNHGTTGITLTSMKCNFDGSYHRVQVLREKKRCVFIDNSPLTEATESSNVNCNCAHDRHLAQIGQMEFLPECLPNGNYKSRQIWDEKLFCIDNDGFYYSDNPQDCPVSL